MSDNEYNEGPIQACYSAWSGTYYEDYYASESAYPPVHRDMVKRLLQEEAVANLLDAGCGPASFLRHMAGEDMELYGFDLTPAMVAEARRVLASRGVPSHHVWQGSVLAPESFAFPGSPGRLFDSAICIGVLPHVPEGSESTVFSNLRNSVRERGLVIVEARNQLFSLFTLNRYSCQFFKEELIRSDELLERADDRVSELKARIDDMERHFRMDLPPVRRGTKNEPGYDEIVSRTHNPLTLKETFASAGFGDVRVFFYHYHCLPPMFESAFPEFFRRESLAMEDPGDWRGYFMASAFLLTGRRL